MDKGTKAMPTAGQVVRWLVRHRSGITEADLAEAMYGVRDQPRIHQECDLLELRGFIRRDRTDRPLRLYPNNDTGN